LRRRIIAAESALLGAFRLFSGLSQQTVRIYRSSFPTVSSNPGNPLGDLEGQTKEHLAMNTLIRTKLHTAIYYLLGTVALGASATLAQAEDQTPPSKTVKFADLDIQTLEGAKVLYHRIRIAARQVCDVSVGSDPILTGAEHTCVDKAIDTAVKKVNAPYLTALRFGGDVGSVRLASK
jgi:UrcA family protein